MAPAVAVSATVAAFLCLAAPYSILAVVGVYRKREEFPFNGREFCLIVPQGIGILAGIAYYPIVGLLDHVPCAIALVLEVHVFSMGLAALCLRCLRWLFLHFASQALRKRRKTRHSPISTWFVDHRHYVTPRFLLKVLLCWTLVAVTITSLLFAFLPTTTANSFGAPPDCLALSMAFLVADLEGAVCCAILVVTAWRLRDADDAYQIKQEIIYLVITGILYFASNNIRRVLPVPTDPAAAVSAPLMGVAVSACWCLALFAIAWFPLSIARREAARVRDGRARHNRGRGGSAATSRGRTGSLQLRESKDGSAAKAGTERRKALARDHRGSTAVQSVYSLPLQVLLTDEAFEELRVDFERHLAAEFAFENLLFWADSGCFIECFDDRSCEETAQHAVQLYNDFVRRNSPYQANFNSAEQEAIQEALKPILLAYERDNPAFDANVEVSFAGHVSKNVFDSARATVYRLMSQGAYVRWQSKSADLVEKFQEKKRASKFDVRPSLSSRDSSNSLAYYKSIVSGHATLNRGKRASNGEVLTPQSLSTSIHSREHMLGAYHSRSTSDMSSIRFSEIGELPSPSPSASNNATASHHRRVHSNASSLGLSETTTYFNFQNVPRNGSTHEQPDDPPSKSGASAGAEV